MAYGTELRVPFLDHNLVEFCFFQPAEHKINRGTQKYLLRKSMSNIVSHAVINNNKISFGAVQSKWLREYLKDFLIEIVDSDSFKSRKYWDSGKVRENVLSLLDGKVENSFAVWQAINLELWLRKHFDK
jgi:asparagine synthase (glutamine-hydrolysing)